VNNGNVFAEPLELAMAFVISEVWSGAILTVYIPLKLGVLLFCAVVNCCP
jgi:hypothetical protein